MSRKKKSKSLSKSKITKNLLTTTLQFINGKRYTPMTAEKLAAQLDIAEVHRDLFFDILRELVADKTLVSIENRLSLPHKAQSTITGTISIHQKGFGFVKAPEGPDVFIPKHLTREAVDGDTVEVEVASVVSAKGPEGAVIAVLKRSRTHLAGIVLEKSKTHFITYSPLLGKQKLIAVKAKPGALKEGDRIICKILHWRDSNDQIEAELTRCIGNISDPSIDIDAAIEEFEIASDFSLEARDEAKAFSKRISKKGRLDLTEEECVTIDPDTAKDFDDAITLTRDEKGHYHLGVHIADVAHYVKPGSTLEKDALERCNSTYFPGRCVPMLPEELSNELCSLKPNVNRLTMSVIASFDGSGTLLNYKVARTVINSKKRFTYREALEVIEGKKKNPHASLLQRMTEFCHVLKQKRYERGSIDFAMPENAIIVDAKGVPQRIERIEYDITHQMIEEFMLKANELTALYLSNQGKSLIYRIHEEPAEESYQDFYALARSLGFMLPGNPDHRDIQTLFQTAKDSPFLHQLSVAFIRSMKLAQYSPDNVGHYGLALEHYCHFTSPIRRYTDLIIQRLLMNELPEETDLEAIARACSEKERISFKAEMSVRHLKKLRLASTHFEEDPTKIYPAVVTKIKPFALFFEVPMFDIEASLHVSQLGNDFFEFNLPRLSFRGTRTGLTYTAGQQIYVRLDRINFILQETEWALVSQPDTIAAKKKHHKNKKQRKDAK
jgi:ribonuclease R